MISKNDLKFRWGYFKYVFTTWLHELVTCRIPKGMVLEKLLITYGVYAEDRLVEYHEGTFLDFVKWLVTHESFDNL